MALSLWFHHRLFVPFKDEKEKKQTADSVLLVPRHMKDKKTSLRLKKLDQVMR